MTNSEHNSTIIDTTRVIGKYEPRSVLMGRRLWLDQTHPGLALFDPLTGTAAIQSATNATALAFTLDDHPVFIKIKSIVSTQADPPVIVEPPVVVDPPVVVAPPVIVEPSVVVEPPVVVAPPAIVEPPVLVDPPVISPPIEPFWGTDGANTIVGNSASTTIKGFGGNDLLKGSGGNDSLYGGAGNDRLYGNSGRDAFVFDTKPHRFLNKDTIVDFSVRDDTIRLDNAVFTKAGVNGAFKSAAFWSSTSGKAHDRSDRIIYDTDSGKVFYDADGTGRAAAVEFATISRNLALTYKDFSVI